MYNIELWVATREAIAHRAIDQFRSYIRMKPVLEMSIYHVNVITQFQFPWQQHIQQYYGDYWSLWVMTLYYDWQLAL